MEKGSICPLLAKRLTMKASFFLVLMIFSMGMNNCFSQQYHIAPINILDCNRFELIFIGTVLSIEKRVEYSLVSFSIDEEFKFRGGSCHLTIKTLRSFPVYEELQDEQWLVFAVKVENEYFFDLNFSTGLNLYQGYAENLIEKDLQYLREYALYPNQEIKEVYQLSGEGCIPNHDFFVGEGTILNSYPHGNWIHYSLDGRVIHEREYVWGQKWGKWLTYFDNRYVASIVLYHEGYEIKRIQYNNGGERICFNESCTFWETSDRYKSLIENSLCETEIRGFRRKKILMK